MADANTRPQFALPALAGTRVVIKTYVGHKPDDKKMDMYFDGWPNSSAVLASAPGIVHESFWPGGIEIRHFIPGTRTLGNWFTTYMHMDQVARIGTVCEQGTWIGRAGTVGTGVKHLHHEQLRTSSGNADTSDMQYPLFIEQGAGASPLHLVPGGPGLSFVSQNGRQGTGTISPKTPNAPLGWVLPRGHYYGLISGPNESHGGFYASERPYIKAIQERLQALGFAPKTAGWADGIFEQPTKDAVASWQRKLYSRFTTRYGEVWSDDWRRLFG
ncbi:hypothetical protein JRI60_43640 [Archangium violaceum]|uniref:peptidoglycan-binding protein n=1 Tax=Archangium violaceum TaxID=83451 RepID=UPI001951E82F|nr:peptidoglycan-binding protein [Archangium violaceum]QRN95869.1 hypothetical protein JRI60_43640 [Archangium violaceum]